MKFKNPHCPDCNCSNNFVWEFKNKWWCRECWDYIIPVERDSKEHEESMNKLFRGKK